LWETRGRRWLGATGGRQAARPSRGGICCVWEARWWLFAVEQAGGCRSCAVRDPWAPFFQPVVPDAFRSNIHGVTFASAWMVDYYTVSKT